MDVDDVSPSSGDGPSTRGHDNETDASLTARLIQMTLREESESFHSVTERWRERTAQTKGLGRVMQRWCQGENQTIRDLEGLAPFVFRHKCVHTLEKTCSSPLCQAVTDVIERSEIFLNYKDRYATAVADHMDAVTTHMNYVDELNREKNQWKQKRSGDRNGATLALWRKLVAGTAAGVSKAAQLVVEVGNVVSLAADLVSGAAVQVTTTTKNIFDCHEKVKIALHALRAAGNETSLIRPVIRQAVARENVPSERRCDIETQSNPKAVATGDGLSLTTTESQPVTSETRSDLESEPCMPAFDTLCSPCDLELDDVDFLPPLSTEQIESLSTFYTHLKYGFGNATILVSNDAQYSLKIEKTVKAILGWNVDDNSSTESTAIEFFSPGCVAQEVVGVQPILYALMFKIIQVLGLEQHVMQEQRIQKVGIRAARVVDFVVSALPEENSAETPAAGIGLPIEAKPVARSNSKVCKVLLGAQNQVVGHLAKKAMFFFDMGGIGEDCTFVGLALSMASIVVLVVELSGVGTESVMITTKRTKQAPLFDEATRKHLFVEKATEVEALFKDALEGQDMPTGFGLLARTLMSVQCGLGTSMMTRSDGCRDTFFVLDDNAEPIEAGRYLGSGAYSHVLELNTTDRDDVFIKIPRYHGMTTHLERECQVLQEVDGHENIPQLHDALKPFKTLHFNIRCEHSALNGLVLKGIIGQPTSHKRKWSSFDLKVIFNNVYDALDHVHKRGWAHLDVRPANIIVCVDDAGKIIKVMLIDWGCARRNGTKETNFVGSLPFAHDELFGLKRKWTPRLCHDLASLVYSVASLSLGCIPWSGFSNHNKLSVDDRNRRCKMASDAWEPFLEDWGLSSEVKQALLKSICQEAR